MLYDVFADVVDTFVRREEGFDRGSFDQLGFLLLANLVGQFVELLLQCLFIQMHLYRNRFEVQLQGGSIRYGVLEGVFREVTLFVLLGTEGRKGVVVATIDRRTGQSEEECIGQGRAHLGSQIPLLGTVCLVHHHDDIRTIGQHALYIAEFENRGDENLSLILLEEVFQRLLVGCRFDVGNLCTGKVSGNLIFEVDTVIDNHDRRSFQLILLAELLRGKYHEPRLS